MMTTKLAELRKLAEAAANENEDAMIELQFEGETILAMCELMQQMRDALDESENALSDYIPTLEKMGASLNYGRIVLRQAKECVAAFDKFNKVKK